MNQKKADSKIANDSICSETALIIRPRARFPIRLPPLMAVAEGIFTGALGHFPQKLQTFVIEKMLYLFQRRFGRIANMLKERGRQGWRPGTVAS